VKQRQDRLRIIFIWIAGLLSVALASPLLLVGLSAAFKFDWTLLSDIGQSYTGISAILSAAALIAVARTIRIQSRQTALAQTLAVHDTQRELVLMALNDPDLLSALDNDSESIVQGKQHVYNTLWMRYYFMQYRIGTMNAGDIRLAMLEERFPQPSVRDHWERVRKYWRKRAGEAQTDQRFVDIVDEAYATFLGSVATSSPSTQPEQNPVTERAT
jgi:Family of unknown function (DUF6082)